MSLEWTEERAGRIWKETNPYCTFYELFLELNKAHFAQQLNQLVSLSSLSSKVVSLSLSSSKLVSLSSSSSKEVSLSSLSSSSSSTLTSTGFRSVCSPLIHHGLYFVEEPYVLAMVTSSWIGSTIGGASFPPS